MKKLSATILLIALAWSFFWIGATWSSYQEIDCEIFKSKSRITILRSASDSERTEGSLQLLLALEESNISTYERAKTDFSALYYVLAPVLAPFSFEEKLRVCR